MRPSYFLAFFAAIGLTVLGMLVFDRPARADVIDAGPAGGVATSPIQLDVPTPKTPAPPDAIEHPTEAIAAVTETDKHSGLWAAIMLGLWIVLHTVGKRTGPGSFLGDGRWAAGIAAGASVAGAGVDVLTLHPQGGLVMLVTVALMGLATVLSPHVKHTEPAS